MFDAFSPKEPWPGPLIYCDWILWSRWKSQLVDDNVTTEVDPPIFLICNFRNVGWQFHFTPPKPPSLVNLQTNKEVNVNLDYRRYLLNAFALFICEKINPGKKCFPIRTHFHLHRLLHLLSFRFVFIRGRWWAHHVVLLQVTWKAPWAGWEVSKEHLQDQIVKTLSILNWNLALGKLYMFNENTRSLLWAGCSPRPSMYVLISAFWYLLSFLACWIRTSTPGVPGWSRTLPLSRLPFVFFTRFGPDWKWIQDPCVLQESGHTWKKRLALLEVESCAVGSKTFSPPQDCSESFSHSPIQNSEF